jgi:nitroreductase
VNSGLRRRVPAGAGGRLSAPAPGTTHNGLVEFAETVRRRRMVRRFDPDRPVPRAAVEAALRLALRAPSAGFSQGWSFVVLDTCESRAAFWGAAVPPAHAAGEPDPWLRGVSAAPVLVVCCSEPGAYLRRYAEPDKDGAGDRWPVPYWDVDTGMAALILLLSAVDQGLGALFFGVPAAGHDEVRRALGIPADRRLVGVVALGHEARRVRSPSLRRGPRRWADVVYWGRFGESAAEAGER